ncbi:MAG: hypothetical protein KJ646_02700 [Nanoarchaeota archaeon]|nr:hypothetical protein [Nanoarchaeota archaeon]
MNKLDKQQIKEITKKLKLFFEKYRKLESEFFKDKENIEKEMSKKIGKMDLEFFYVDGECVGIGAANWNDRKACPLIQSCELED